MSAPTGTPNVSATDRIEEQVRLRAPRARVWRALTDPAEFGAWFGARFTVAAFAPGEEMRGHIAEPGYEHMAFGAVVEAVEPERRFAFRWHPYAVDPNVDYTAEPTTLVEFTLEDAPDGGTLLRVTESGFDALPPQRRETAFRVNRGGWEEQMRRVARFLDA